MEFPGGAAMNASIGNALEKALEHERETVAGVCRKIFQLRELMFEERESAAVLSGLLQERGFSLRKPVAGLETAFAAEWSSGSGGGPRLGLLAEYDALPVLGHACGHNMIAAAAAGAALAIRRLEDRFHGTLVLFGTPAEEGGGGKVAMAEAGCFDDLDGVIYFHPSVRDDLYGPTLACRMVRVALRGREAHVQLNPQEGRNALQALVQVLTRLREEESRLPPLCRIGSIVTEGGQNPFLVPGLARGEFVFSAGGDEDCEGMAESFREMLKGAAQATGTSFELETLMRYPSVRINRTMTGIISARMQEMGLRPAPVSPLSVSTDCGATSLRCPFGAFRLQLGNPAPFPHTVEFADLAGGPEGEEKAFLAARIQAFVLMDLFASASSVEAARREFAAESRK
jgi:amidohydrolase